MKLTTNLAEKVNEKSMIALNRRFDEWREQDPPNSDLRPPFGRPGGALGWDYLLAKRRVVLLAEAGSGKTVEMAEQARLQTEAGRFAFYATVEDVGHDGLESALRAADRTRLATWRTSNEAAWFFIDSVDEAKLIGVRLEKALRRLGDGIVGAERRAHIVLSGRHTDWEFKRDLERLKNELPIPNEPVSLPPPTPDEILISTLRHERPKEEAPTVEQPLIVLMASLDAERVRRFATAEGVPDVDALMAQIDAANLWRFARRPLDLEWLVRFWRSHGRVGTLAEMLESSLTERLQETNLDRTRGDSLDVSRAFYALERIGAALVFGRKATVAIPDGEVALTDGNRPIDVAEVLPDWSADHRTRLLTRPVFDPATFGRARLHNDNEGVVSGYLTARWLSRLRRENLPLETIFDLLFATTYGIELIKPSMRETAAWLAIGNEDIAREVGRRDLPLLLTAGDPASLPADVRRSVLTRLVEQITSQNHELPLLDADSVKRFSRPDLSEVIGTLWSKHQSHPEVCSLLLRLIWLGSLRDCADLATDFAIGTYSDRDIRIIAGRAVLTTGDDPAKRRYAERIKTECDALPNTMVWDAIDGLFPNFLSVDDLLVILAKIDVTDTDGGFSFEWQSPELVKRINSPSDLERLLNGLLEQLGGEACGLGYQPDKREEAYFAAMNAAVCRLLESCSDQESPVLAIDAALRIGEHRRNFRALRKLKDVGEGLHRTAARRRLAFWRAAERLNGHPMLRGRRLESLWDMKILGYSTGLRIEDLDWLLADGPGRLSENERRLAVNAAVQLWRETGEDAALLARIKEVAQADGAMSEAFETCMRPRTPSALEIQLEREHKETQVRMAAEQAACHQSWIDFLANLRANPGQLRQLRPMTAEGVDKRLYHLWQLLDKSVNARTGYAIDGVASLEPILGPELTAAVRDGLIEHWRGCRPRLRSDREPSMRNQIRCVDCMGIVGVTLDANLHEQWAEGLTSGEATLAASYATIEINGFPRWMSDLAVAKPQEVLAVLKGEIAAEFAFPELRLRFEVLDSISRGDGKVIELMAPALLGELEQRLDLPPVALMPMLEVINRGLRENREHFSGIALYRFNSMTDAQVCALYLSAVFCVDPSAAISALNAKLETMNAPGRAALVEQLLPRVFGGRFVSAGASPEDLPFGTLERLVWIAFSTIRVEQDRDRTGSGGYTPDDRDHAEEARGAAFNRLVETPGRATFDALLRIAEHPDRPIPPSRLQAIARHRAAEDSESAPWSPAEPRAFERSFETAPYTARDLQRVALRRIADIQHELLHGDFAQGATVGALPDEPAVQKWVADRLRLKQGRTYSIEREPHVIDEKEPDIRFRAKASDASVAMEIKVAESWSVPDLEAALTTQLCGRYLRAKDARYGILLLVHQDPRPKGWKEPETDVFLSFGQVVERLKRLAVRISGTVADAPQPEISFLDVSSCARSKRNGDVAG
jgi:hypothetical protein